VKNHHRQLAVLCSLWALAVLISPAPAADRLGDSARPNFLIALADDCTHNDLPLYGGRNAHAPNIDALARQGLTFNRAYLCMAMCQPCRAELYTGQCPLRNGCAWNHSASRPGTRSLPQHLGKLGYRTGLAGKVHLPCAASQASSSSRDSHGIASASSWRNCLAPNV